MISVFVNVTSIPKIDSYYLNPDFFIIFLKTNTIPQFSLTSF